MAAFDQPWAPTIQTGGTPFGKIVGLEKNKKALILHFENVTQDLTITFPNDGGIRINNEYQGFFVPEKVCEIEYTVENKIVALKSTSGETIWLDVENGTISFDTCKEEKITISMSDMLCGENKTKVFLPYTKDEVFYGFGERFNGFNQNGKEIPLWNIDTIYHVYSGEGEKPESYKNVPFYHSSKGYSLFYNTFYNGQVSFEEELSLEFGGPELDLFIWTSTPLKNLAGYIELTGKPILPPKWAFRYWAGAGACIWMKNGSSDESVLGVLQEVLDGYNKLGTGLPVLYTEYPTPFIEETYKKAEKNGTKIMMWIRPSLNRKEMKRKLPRVKDFELPVCESLDWTRVKDNIDFTSPNAKDLVKAIYGEQWKWGLKGSMIDFGEYWTNRSFYQSGAPGNPMHNMSTYYYNKVIHEAWYEEMGDDYVTISRSGCAGSQHWSACFGGDQASRWYGLEQSLYGMLSLASTGFSNWGSDIGGFFGVPEQEVYCRWLQFGTFSPLMRSHGISIDKSPWNFGEEACEQFKKYFAIRERILDTVYSSAVKASKTGLPMVKPLAMAYPFDAKAQAVADEYIFCDTFLVAPVVTEDVREREVYLPEGEWIDFWTGNVVNGKKTINAMAPFDQIPVFIAQNRLLRVGVDVGSGLIGDTTNDTRKVLLITRHTKKTLHTIYGEEKTFQYEVDYDGMTLTVRGDMDLEIRPIGFTPEKIVSEDLEVSAHV